MSRVGKKPIPLPNGVTATIDGAAVTVKGPKGELVRAFSPDIGVRNEDGHILVTRPSDHRHHRALHGLTRALIQNMVTGVSTGYRKTLEIIGVGYRAELIGKSLSLTVGYSHPIVIAPPEGITFGVEKQTHIAVEGISKDLVGEVAAMVRRFRPPEPYKGKGIRYTNEVVRRKAGKSAAG